MSSPFRPVGDTLAPQAVDGIPHLIAADGKRNLQFPAGDGAVFPKMVLPQVFREPLILHGSSFPGPLSRKRAQKKKGPFVPFGKTAP